jgi:hypothetical protein
VFSFNLKQNSKILLQIRRLLETAEEYSKEFKQMLRNPENLKLCLRQRRKVGFRAGLICHFNSPISDYLYNLASRLLPQNNISPEWRQQSDSGSDSDSSRLLCLPHGFTLVS